MAQDRKPQQARHDRTCAERIRTRRLVQAGEPSDPPTALLHQIAREIRACCGHSALKAHRLAYGWTVDEAVTAFHEMCKHQKLGARGLTGRSWLEWEAGARPNSDYQDLLCRLFATGPVQLGLAADYSHASEDVEAPAGAPLALGRLGDTTERGTPTNRRDGLKHIGANAVTPAGLTGVLREAAAEAMEFTQRAEASAVGPGVLQHLELAVTEFNLAYARTSPAELFDTVRWYRRAVDRLLAGPHTLREGRELYAYAGWLSQLLAWIAFELGNPTAAEAYGVDAWHHGWQAEHDELCTWALDPQASIALYKGQPRQALTTALRGAQQAPADHYLAVRFGMQAARAYARLGQREDFDAALRESLDRYERLPARPPAHFGLDTGQLAAYAVTSYAASSCNWLDLAEQARRHATDALDLLAAAPEKDRSPDRETNARIDLALALVRSDHRTRHVASATR
jgi:hypothetical protein